MNPVSKVGMRIALSVGALMAGAWGVAAQEIKVWSLPFNDGVVEAWDKIVDEFEAANPGVTIITERRSIDEHKSALRVAAGSDQAPDIFFSWAGLGLGGEYIKAGLSLPLDKYYEQYKWDETYLPSTLGFSRQYDGGRHGVPYTFHGEQIYYSKAAFEKAGIASEPATYEELVAAADKLKAAGIPAWTFGGSVNWHIMRLMDVILETECGAEKHDALMNMEVDWSTEPCATSAFEEFHMWTSQHFLKPFMGIDQAQAFNLFLADRAGMMLEGDWLVGQLKGEDRMDDFGMFPFPTDTNRLYGFAEYFYISSKSENPDVAAKFLDYLGSTEVQQKYLGAFGSASVNAAVTYADQVPLDVEWLETFAKYTDVFVNGDQAFPLDVTTEYFRVINEVASDNIAPADAAAAMQTFISNRS